MAALVFSSVSPVSVSAASPTLTHNQATSDAAAMSISPFFDYNVTSGSGDMPAITIPVGDLTPEIRNSVQDAAILNVWDVSLPQAQVCLDALAGLRAVSRYSATSYTNPSIGAVMQVTNNAPTLSAYGTLTPINSSTLSALPNTAVIQIYEVEPTSLLISEPRDFGGTWT